MHKEPVVSQNLESNCFTLFSSEQQFTRATDQIRIPHTLNRKSRMVLYLFSGASRQGSLSYWVSKLGFTCVELDSHATPPTDLLDCHQWEQILNDVGEDKYCAVIASPP